MCIKFLGSLATKSVPLNRQSCWVIPTFIDLHPNEPLYLFTAFVCNAKSSESAILFFCCLFLLVTFSEQADNNVLPMNCLWLPTTSVTKTEFVSLYTSDSVYVLLVVILDSGGHYLFNMHIELFSILY